MYCDRCGEQLNSSSKYCPACGAHMPAETTGYTPSWYYMINQNQFGPYSQEQMQEYIVKGLLKQDVLVWTNRMPNWVPIYETELWQYFPNKPLSDTTAWLMGTIPPLIGIIIPLLAKFTLLPLPENLYQLCTVSFGIFGIVDMFKIAKSTFKFSCSKWLWTGLICTPLYLFLRAAKTNKRYGYAITWCILYAVSIWICIIIL